MGSFLKLKVVHKELVFLNSTYRHKALIEKLSGKALKNMQENFSVTSPYSYPLISNLSEILKTLNKIHNDLEMKIFTFPAY